MKSLSRIEHLRMLLILAGTPDLGSEAIERYMEHEASRYKPNWLWRLDQACRGRLELYALSTVAIPLAICLLGDQVVINSIYFPMTIAVWTIAVVLFLLIGQKIGPAEWSRYQLQLRGNYRSYESVKLRRQEPVPQFVTDRALRIKRFIPEAAFEVAALEQERTPLDPVLYLIVGDIAIPVDIWKGQDRILLS